MSTWFLHGIETEYCFRGLPPGRAKRAAQRYESIYQPSNGEKIRRFFTNLLKK